MSTTASDSRTVARVGNALGLVFVLVFLVVAHQHDVWRPWLGGLVTEAWVDVLWAVDLSLITQAVGHAILFLAGTRFLRALTDLANTLTGLVSLWVTYSVYPFALGMLDGPFRLFLVFLVIVVGIASIASVARLATVPFARR